MNTRRLIGVIALLILIGVYAAVGIYQGGDRQAAVGTEGAAGGNQAAQLPLDDDAGPAAEAPAKPAETPAAPEAAKPEAAASAESAPAASETAPAGEGAATAPAPAETAAKPETPSAPAAEQSAPAAEQTVASAEPSAGEAKPAPAEAVPSSAAAPVPPPSFDVVRVEPTGEAVVAGQAAPKSTVEILDGSTPIATAEAGETGEWAMPLDKPLPPGTHDLAIRTTSADKKTVTLSDQRVAVSVPEPGSKDVLVVVNTPDAASKVLEAGAGEAAPASPVPAPSETASAAKAAPAEAAKPEAPPAETTVAAASPIAEEPAPAASGTAGEAAPAAEAPAAAAPAAEAPAAEGSAPAAAPETAEAPATAPSSAAPSTAEAPAASSEPAPAASGETAIASAPTTEAPAPEAPAAAETSKPEAPAAEAPSTEAPAAEAPAAEPAKPAPAVAVTAVEAETAGTLYIAGTAATKEPVRVYLDDQLVGEAKPTEGGTWLLQAPRELAPGRYTVRADQVDAGGNVVVRAEVPFERELDVAVLKPEASAGAGSGAEASGTVPGPQTVIIKRGDNLWRISRSVYGRGIRWSTIYTANKDQIRNPRWIYPGQVFVVPAGDTSWKN